MKEIVNKASQSNSIDFTLLQLNKSIETFQSQNNLLVQITTILLIGNITLIGFGLEFKSAGLLFLGIVFPIFAYLVNRTVTRLMIPIVYSAITIENKFQQADLDWLATTFIRTFGKNAIYEKLIEISKIDNSEKRMQKLKKLKHISSYSNWFNVSLLICAICQLFLPLLLIWIYHWPLI